MFRWNVPPWLWTKLGFVFGLTVYHIICHRMFKKFQKDEVIYGSFGLRVWNEVATVFLFVIVFIVVLKTTLTLYGAALIILLSGLLYAGIVAYKKRRK
jgi:putative membrane protein